MQLQGKAIRITIYIGERDSYQGKALSMALLQFLKAEGASGATVTRGVAGFGARSRIHTATIMTLSEDLPLRVEWVDRPQVVARLLPQVRKMVDSGLIVMEEIDVVQYAPGRRHNALNQPVRDVMQTTVVSVPTDTPPADMVSLLLEQRYRSLAVVDANGRLQGIITDGDLLHRAGLTTRLGLHDALDAEQLQKQIDTLRTQPETAVSIMSQPVISVQADDSLRLAMSRMVENNLKRLPVVEADNQLVGWISRVDILRTLAYYHPVPTTETEQPQSGHAVTELMYQDVPTVMPDAPLEAILQALETNRRRRAIVVDADGHVQGIISDGDLVRRSRAASRPGLIARLRGLITGQTASVQLSAASETAVDLMTSPAITISTDTPLVTALNLMMQHGIKRLPVVDEDGRLVGLLGRGSLLRGMLQVEE
ncbi:MAG: DUF190 domain-containing protein [Anaerolineae bacterium]